MRSSSCTVVAWEQQKSRVPWTTSWVPERVKLPSIICKGLKGGRQTEMPRNLSGVMTNPLRRPALLLQHSCLGCCRCCRCCSTGPDRTAGWMDDSSRPRQTRWKTGRWQFGGLCQYQGPVWVKEAPRTTWGSLLMGLLVQTQGSQKVGRSGLSLPLWYLGGTRYHLLMGSRWGCCTPCCIWYIWWGLNW